MNYHQLYYKKNKKKIDDYTKKWQKDNIERTREINRRAVSKITRRLRLSVLTKLDLKCNKCGIFEPIYVLQIDHIYGGGNQEIKKLGGSNKYYKYLDDLSIQELKENYQILCANCNLIKRHENHESKGKPRSSV